MASKKSVRKTPAKKPLKAKTPTKQKPLAKKGKTKPALKPTATKKKVTPAKSSGKKKPSSKASSAKKKVLAHKSVPKNKKTITKKTLVKSTPKSKNKKTVTKKPVVQTKKTAIPKKNVKSSPGKKPIQKSASSSAPAAPRVSKTKEPVLSAHERYNIGGLFACAIERANDPDCSRLRAVLRHLDLSSQEKDNLIRLSEGLMIPKLFAESVPEQKVGLALTDLVKFAMRERSYEKHWREELQQIGLWLGMFPAQVQEIEQRIKR